MKTATTIRIKKCQRVTTLTLSFSDHQTALAVGILCGGYNPLGGKHIDWEKYKAALAEHNRAVDGLAYEILQSAIMQDSPK